jgi:hypothetical protein
MYLQRNDEPTPNYNQGGPSNDGIPSLLPLCHLPNTWVQATAGLNVNHSGSTSMPVAAAPAAHTAPLTNNTCYYVVLPRVALTRLPLKS